PDPECVFPLLLAERRSGDSGRMRLSSSSRDFLSSPSIALAGRRGSSESISAAFPTGSAPHGSVVGSSRPATTESPEQPMIIASLGGKQAAGRNRQRRSFEWDIDALPRDLMVVTLLGVASLAVTLFEGPSLLRVALGLPMVLFLPGYAIVSSFFPAKEALDGIGRVALGFSLSLAAVAPIGLMLDRSPWGVTRPSIAL